MTVEPRDVEVRFKDEFRVEGSVHYWMSSSPGPGILRACHEARNLGLYQRAFSFGNKPRYTWVNFEMDMISLGDTDIRDIVDERLDIRRLRFERESNEWFFYYESKGLKDFANLIEIHVICLDGFFAWLDSWEHVEWQCPRENVRFIEKESRKMIDGYELDKMWDEVVEETRRRENGNN